MSSKEVGFNLTTTMSWILPTTWRSVKWTLSSRWEHGPANTLVSAFWGPEQTTQLFCAQISHLQKLWDHKWLLIHQGGGGKHPHTPWGFFLSSILRQGLMSACFCLVCSSLAFSPHILLTLSLHFCLWALFIFFTNMLSSLASLSCFDTVVKYSVLLETLSVPHHCDLLGSLVGGPAAASRHSFVSVCLHPHNTLWEALLWGFQIWRFRSPLDYIPWRYPGASVRRNSTWDVIGRNWNRYSQLKWSLEH